MKKLLLGSLVWVACGYGLSPIRAQTTLSGDHVIDGDLSVGNSTNKSKLIVNGETGSSAAPGLSVFGDGGVVFGGQNGFFWDQLQKNLNIGSGWIGGTRSLAIDGVVDGGDRAIAVGGSAGGDGWNVAIGNGSAAFNCPGGVALGGGELEYGSQSIAAADSLGVFSVKSMAVGDSVVSESERCIAVGASAIYSGTDSVAGGTGQIDSGSQSAALNGGVVLSAFRGFAANAGFAYANYGTAIGEGTVSASPNCFAVGLFNDAQYEGDTGLKPTDQLFVVGNGTGNFTQDSHEIAFHDAFWVQRNGDVRIAKRQGDILMGEFGNPE